MAWMKWVKGLSRRTEILVMANRLKLDSRIVACACMEVWEWADDNTTGGQVSGLKADIIGTVVRLEGFHLAMIEVGWLKEDSSGFHFPKWDRHNSETAKTRAIESHARSVRRKGGQVSAPSTGQVSSISEQIGGGKEKRREESNTPPSPPKGGDGFVNPWKKRAAG